MGRCGERVPLRDKVHRSIQKRSVTPACFDQERSGKTRDALYLVGQGTVKKQSARCPVNPRIVCIKAATTYLPKAPRRIHRHHPPATPASFLRPGAEEDTAIRAKIRKGDFAGLNTEIAAQKAAAIFGNRL